MAEAHEPPNQALTKSVAQALKVQMVPRPTVLVMKHPCHSGGLAEQTGQQPALWQDFGR